MEKIKTEQEAWKLISNIQNMVGNNFRLVTHSINNGNVYIYPDQNSGFRQLKKVKLCGILLFRQIDGPLDFSGNTLVEAAQNLAAFFENGGEARVSGWKDHDSYSARLCLKNGEFVLEKERHCRTTDSEGAL